MSKVPLIRVTLWSRTGAAICAVLSSLPFPSLLWLQVYIVLTCTCVCCSFAGPESECKVREIQRLQECYAIMAVPAAQEEMVSLPRQGKVQPPPDNDSYWGCMDICDYRQRLLLRLVAHVCDVPLFAGSWLVLSPHCPVLSCLVLSSAMLLLVDICVLHHCYL